MGLMEMACVVKKLGYDNVDVLGYSMPVASCSNSPSAIFKGLQYSLTRV